MGLERTDTRQVSVLDEALRGMELITKGNELLNKAKEVANRIEERCLQALRTNPDIRERPSSRTA
jgi:hypothetical protein